MGMPRNELDYSENTLEYVGKFKQAVIKSEKTKQKQPVKREALQSLTHNLSSLIECTQF